MKGSKFKELRKELNLSQSEMGDVLGGIDKSNISRVENDKMPLPLDWIDLIETEYNIDLSDLKVVSTNEKQVAIYDTEVFGTISPAMSDMVTMKPTAFVSIPLFNQGEAAVQVTGNSMKGVINHGDWIVVKKINNVRELIYGEAYLIVTREDNLKTVKYLCEDEESPEEYFYLSPYNIEQFRGQRIRKDDIIEIHKVVGLFRSI